MLIFLDCWAGAWGSCPSCFPTRARSCTRSAYPLPVFRRVLSLLLLGPPVGGRLDAPRCRSNCADISECLPPMEYLPVCLAGAGCCPLSAPFVSRALGSSPGSRCWGPVTTDHKYPHCSLPLVGPSDCCTRTPPPLSTSGWSVPGSSCHKHSLAHSIFPPDPDDTCIFFC